MRMTIVLSLLLVLCGSGIWDAEASKKKGWGEDDSRATYLSDVPNYPGNVILGRPADRFITSSVLMHKAIRIRIEYGNNGKLSNFTEAFDLRAGEPCEIAIGV